MTSSFSVLSREMPMLYPFFIFNTMCRGSEYSDLGMRTPSNTSPDVEGSRMMLPTFALDFVRRRRISPWYPSSREADMLSDLFGMGWVFLYLRLRIFLNGVSGLLKTRFIP